MTYVELIVVLSIFGVMSSIVLFNYGAFQAKVDIKVLANQIASKIVQAQKDAMNGKLPVQNVPPNWKPTYGVYFDITDSSTWSKFIYFVKPNITSAGLVQTTYVFRVFGVISGTTCDHPVTSSSGDCVDEINITKGNKILDLNYFLNNDPTPHELGFLNITFTRPDSKAYLNGSVEINNLPDLNYVEITISTADEKTKSFIDIYSSGRIQIK